MRLASLQSVNSLVGERDRLIRLQADVEMDQVNLVVRGTYLDDALTALVRPVLLREIEARLHQADAALRQLGVQIG